MFDGMLETPRHEILNDSILCSKSGEMMHGVSPSVLLLAGAALTAMLGKYKESPARSRISIQSDSKAHAECRAVGS